MSQTNQSQADIVVAGHICLDVIPTFGEHSSDLANLLVPGKLVDVGPAIMATGGGVANTGLALHQLGVPTRLMGKIGADKFGESILDILRDRGETLTDGMIVVEGEETSYTIVISPPGVDRIFFHNPGANNTFQAGDVKRQHLIGAKIFHFGYPSLMRGIYADGGLELANLMKEVKQLGLTTSLDMAYPDPDSEAGQVDWRSWLERVLPHIDIFLPSFDETLFMLHRSDLERLNSGALQLDGTLLRDLAQQLLDMGVAIVGLKLGDQGLYVQTTVQQSRLEAMGSGQPSRVTQWVGRELLAPCFKANVVGTTGAGDCTIAGFLAGLSKGLPFDEVVTMAVAVGGFSVESADATGGVPQWDTVLQRVEAGWAQLPQTILMSDS